MTSPVPRVTATMSSLILLLCLTVLPPVVKATDVLSTDVVRLNATPSTFQEVLTRELSLNCTLPHTNNTEFSNVISLILSKADPNNDNVFVEVASVTEYSSNGPDVRNNSVGGTASGHVAKNLDAFLAMKWTSPNSSVSGRYKCEAFGVDRLGHPRTSTAELVIVENPVDIPSALSKVSELYKILDNQTNVISLMDKILASCGGDKILYNNHLYSFSGPSSVSSSSGQALCRSEGGYLAEINDRAEYQRLQSYVTAKLNTADKWVMLGASDERKEGSWMFLNSNKPATFFDWGSSFSHTNQYNCMFFHRQGGLWKMEDAKCEAATRYVLCETNL